jgi:hypothetical protein
MSKITKPHIRAAIKRAKDLYAKYKFAKQQAREMKWKIVKISDEVCDIHFGGRNKQYLEDIKSRKIYTLKQFALDVGVHPETLQKWSEEYRNIVKPLEEEGLMDVNNITKENALIIRNMSRPIKGRINRKTSREDLIKRYHQVVNKSKEDRLLERYILAANSVFNFVNEHQLDKLDQEEVGHLRTIVGNINDILNPFSTQIIKQVKNTRRKYDEL